MNLSVITQVFTLSEGFRYMRRRVWRKLDGLCLLSDRTGPCILFDEELKKREVGDFLDDRWVWAQYAFPAVPRDSNPG